MKILYLGKNIDTNGVTSHIISLSKELIKEGYKIGVVSGGGDCLTKLEDRNIPHYLIPFEKNNPVSIIFNFIRISKVVLRFKPDLLHVHWPITSIYAEFIKFFFHIPFVSTLHLKDMGKGLKRRLFVFWGNKSIAISSETKDDLIKRYKRKKSSITTIYHGVDTEYFQPASKHRKKELQEKYLIPEGAVVIASMGRIVPQKGYEYLIQASEIVKGTHTIQQLYFIAGDGDKSYLKQLKLEAENRGLTNLFRFPGWSDAKEIYSICDIFVLPSLKEGFPMVVVEAMAMGLVVIRTNISGAKDQIKNGINGIIIEKGNINQLARAIAKCCLDKDYRYRLGNNARDTAVEIFSEPVMIKQYDDFYKKFR